MTRMSRNIVLAVLGTAAVLGCCLPSCLNPTDEPVRDEQGNVVRDPHGRVVTRRHYFRPWFWPGFGYGGGYGGGWFGRSSPNYSPRPGAAPSRPGGSRPSGTATSRGGFGGTGHAPGGS